MVLLIHVLLMYCVKACKGSVTAFVSSRWKAAGISSAGRKGRAKNFRIRRCVPRSLMYACWRPSSWTYDRKEQTRV